MDDDDSEAPPRSVGHASLRTPVPETKRDTDETMPAFRATKKPEDRPAGLAMLGEKPRRRWIAPLAAIALGIVAVIIVWVVRGRSPAQWRPEVIDLPQSEESSDGASLSPDGTRIAWSSNRSEEQFRIYVANADGSDERRLPQEASFDEPRWTRDGKHLLSSAGANDLQRVPVDGGAPILLGATGNSPDDCGKGVVFIRAGSDGYRLLYKPYDGAERELLRAYADEWLEKPRCDPSGTSVVFLRGMAPASAFGTDVFVIDVGGGKAVPLTSDHNAGAATFSNTGDTVVFATRLGDGKIQLVEAPVTGGPPRQVTFDDGPDGSPDVSRDGTTLLFAREVNLFSIYGGEGASTKPRKLSSRRESAYNLRVASPAGDVLLAERAPGEVLVIDTVRGSDRVLTPGRLPFPSLDGKTVFFRHVDDAGQLMAIPIAGGAARQVAKLPGRIVLGTDGPDGQHVMVDEDEHHLVSNRVSPDGTLTDEGAHWVVPAPVGAWRFWQKPGAEIELRVIAPGKPLGSMDCVFTVESTINQWLDEHRLAFMNTIEVDVDGKPESHEVWHILDVRTCVDDKPKIERIDVGSHGINAVMAPDGKHWFTTKSVSRVTRHLARNFGSRPR